MVVVDVGGMDAPTPRAPAPGSVGGEGYVREGGALVGAFVGALVGTVVGTADGTLVGALDGTRVGASDGTNEGSIQGSHPQTACPSRLKRSRRRVTLACSR